MIKRLTIPILGKWLPFQCLFRIKPDSARNSSYLVIFHFCLLAGKIRRENQNDYFLAISIEEVIVKNATF